MKREIVPRASNVIRHSAVALGAMVVGLFALPSNAEQLRSSPPMQLTQSSDGLVKFRTDDLLIGFVPDSFSFFPFTEYREYGIIRAVELIREWSSIDIRESNTDPNMIVFRDRSFDLIVESEHPVNEWILPQLFGGKDYQQNLRQMFGSEDRCFVFTPIKPTGRIIFAVVFLSSKQSAREETVCVVQGTLAAFGVDDTQLLAEQVTISADSGRVVLGDKLKQVFSGIYVS